MEKINYHGLKAVLKNIKNNSIKKIRVYTLTDLDPETRECTNTNINDELTSKLNQLYYYHLETNDEQVSYQYIHNGYNYTSTDLSRYKTYICHLLEICQKHKRIQQYINTITENNIPVNITQYNQIKTPQPPEGGLKNI